MVLVAIYILLDAIWMILPAWCTDWRVTFSDSKHRTYYKGPDSPLLLYAAKRTQWIKNTTNFVRSKRNGTQGVGFLYSYHTMWILFKKEMSFGFSYIRSLDRVQPDFPERLHRPLESWHKAVICEKSEMWTAEWERYCHPQSINQKSMLTSTDVEPGQQLKDKPSSWAIKHFAPSAEGYESIYVGRARELSKHRKKSVYVDPKLVHTAKEVLIYTKQGYGLISKRQDTIRRTFKIKRFQDFCPT